MKEPPSAVAAAIRHVELDERARRAAADTFTERALAASALLHDAAAALTRDRPAVEAAFRRLADADLLRTVTALALAEYGDLPPACQAAMADLLARRGEG